MSIEIPDWVVEAAAKAFFEDQCPSDHWVAPMDEDEREAWRDGARKILRAALDGWFAECGTTYYDTRDASLPTQVSWDSEPVAKTKVFTLRKDKTP